MSLRRLTIPLIVILAIACLGVAACGSDDGGGDGLVGQWRSVGSEMGGTLEFTADGKMIAAGEEPEDGSIEFSYSTDGDEILLGEAGGSEMQSVATYSIEGDTLTIIDSETGEPDVYERIE